MNKSVDHSNHRRRIRVASVLFVFVLAATLCAHSQVDTGTPNFGSFGGGSFDTINLSNLNVHFAIPVFSRQGRAGLSFSYALTYDSSIWAPVNVNGVTKWLAAQNFGWNDADGAGTIYFDQQSITTPWGCFFRFQNFVYLDPSATIHNFAAAGTLLSCNNPASITAIASDGSGYTMVATASGGLPQVTIYSRSGETIYPGYGIAAFVRPATVVDSNGNRITQGSGCYEDNATCVITDTLNSTAVQFPWGDTAIFMSPHTPYKYTAPGGNQVAVQTNRRQNNGQIQTNFGVPGIQENFPAYNLVDNIALADGSSYKFTYEPSPPGNCRNVFGCITGRIASITLPTGGKISYSYNGGWNGIFMDGSTAGFVRTESDGTNSFSTTYWRSGSGQTHVIDPQGNETILDFSGNYETQRRIYQGDGTSGTLQKTIVTCYNGVDVSACGSGETVTPPIQSRVQYTTLGGVTSRYDEYYNSYGLVTERDFYDWGIVLLRKEVITYAPLGNNIQDRSASVTTYDAGGNMVAQTNYQYDEQTYCCAPAVAEPAQHVAVNGSRGNPTSISRWTGASNTFLTEHVSYDDTGSPTSVTDVNGAITTINYGTDLAANCQNTFPTSVTLPAVNGIAMTESTVWDCMGAVATQTTDVNGKTAKTFYKDPNFWRSTAIQDPLLNEVDFSYPSSAPYNWVESSLVFGNSTDDVRATVDGLGRPSIEQLKQSPSSSSYESIQMHYDEVNKQMQTTLPFLAGASQGGGIPDTTTTYDALGRPVKVTNAGGGVVSYSYSNNDVLITAGPAPAGENAKKAQYEFDAVGRLTSVCEITTGSGSLTCGQSNAQSGYWTRYQYDTVGNLTGICQYTTVPLGTDCVQNPSVGQQTRKFAYDALGRLTSETNPESGTTKYMYDVENTTCAGLVNIGDLVYRKDANGSITCYGFDALHRVWGISYHGGSTNSQNTHWKLFTYDSATVNGRVMQNAMGRLARAYTCVAPCGSPIQPVTDEGFSYDERGQLKDLYESTPHSGGYYHSNLSHYPDGSPQTLSSSFGLPNITYGGLEGEGRITQVTSSNGQNPVTGVSYNTTSQPLGALTKVIFGSGDSDNFAFDANTGSMTQYQFNVGSSASGVQSVTGNLTWNQNSSLASLNVTDAISPADSQTCTYSQDDLGRIANTSCNNPQNQQVWNQEFTYDSFGNIIQNGNLYFNPGYDEGTNRFISPSNPFGYYPIYDNNGNLTWDTTHSYSWDAENKPVTIDYVGLTYDALGRVVEQAVNLGCAPMYKQVVYGPGGGKLALMNGQIIQKAFVPLPGGATAVYGSPIINGLASLMYYQHSDWLGSSRLESSPTQQWLYDGAYGPFGEPYAEAVANGGAVEHSFTGQNEDTVAGLYDFLFREYSPTQGRWVSPDPLGLGAASLMDPQTLNLYAYVGNNPLGAIDPDGLDSSLIYNAPTGSGNGGGGGGGGGLGGFFAGLFSLLSGLFGGGHHHNGSGGYVAGPVPVVKPLPAPPPPVYATLMNLGHQTQQFNNDVVIGGSKEVANTALAMPQQMTLYGGIIGLANGKPLALIDLAQAVAFQPYQFEASNSTQKWSMRGVFAGTFLVPGFGEEGATFKITSAIGKDAGLIRLAEEAGANMEVQRGLDGLFQQLTRGNLSAGGSKAIGGGIFELRSGTGARLYFRQVAEGFEIVAKSSKANQARVIQKLMSIYGF